MTLLKIPLLIAVCASYVVAMTPPTPPASQDDKKSYKGLNLFFVALQKTVHQQVAVKKLFVALMVLIDILFVLCDGHLSPTHKTLSLCASSNQKEGRAYISPMFVLGLIFTVAGAFVRVSCYRELGRHFTYELSICEKHELVTTGPYAIVRHPAYTGVILISVGATLCGAAPGSWWSETQTFHTMTGTFLAVAWLCCLLMKFAAISRAPKEDVMLRQQFGKTWDAYASVVKYRYIPGIY